MRLTTLILALFATVCAFAQQYAFQEYSVHQGLVQSEANDLVQDELGYLWVATSGGLSRFDGTYFDNYSLQDGLTDKIINTLHATRDGKVWIGTFQGGVCYYKDKRIRTFDHKEFQGKTIYFIKEAPDGRLVFGTSDGLYTYDYKNIRLIPTPLASQSQEFKTALITSTQRVLVANSGGEIMELIEGALVTVVSGKFQGVYHLAEYDKDRVCVSTYAGPFDLETIEPVLDIEGSWCTFVFEDVQGALWVSYPGRGVYRYANGKGIMLHQGNGLPSNTVHTIMQDREGNVWLGTYGKGIIKYMGDTYLRYGQKEGLQDENVIGVCKGPEGNLMVTGLNRAYYNIKDGDVEDRFKQKAHSSASIWKIHFDKAGTEYHATNLGLFKKQGGSWKHIYGGVVYDVLSELDGTVWVAREQGLAKLKDGKQVEFDRNQFFKGKGGRILHLSKTGTLYIGTFGSGLYKMDAGTPIPVGRKALSRAFVTGIVEDKKGNIWIATNGNGLVQLNTRSNNVITYTTEDGLETNNVKSVLIDEGRLWMGTSSGVMSLNLLKFHSDGSFSINTYARENLFEGIECNRNAIVKGDDGRIWLGTVNGLVGLTPISEEGNFIAPRVYIRDIEVYYEAEGWKHYSDSIEIKTGLPVGLVLPYNLNKVTISFGSVSFTSPEQVSFTYKLEGREDAWSKASIDKKVIYSGLEPGKYTFRLKAINESGIRSTQEAIWKFEITPPYWDTWWFYTMIVVFSGIIIVGLIYWRVNKLRREKVKLETLILKRTAELLEQRDELEKKNEEKEVLLKEVHHRVKNNLQVIISLLSLQSQKIDDRETIRALKDTQNRVMSMALVHKRLYQSADFAEVEFEQYLIQLCQTIRDSYGSAERIQHFIECDSNVRIDVETAIPLGLIINELVTNSYKYAFQDRESGTVSIRLRELDDNKLMLTCEDDGVGFTSQPDLENIESLGLQLVDALVDQVQGEITVSSQEGARYEIIFPKEAE